MTVILADSESQLRETSREHMERFCEVFSQLLNLIGLADRMRLSAVHAGHIGVCSVGATPQDSWEVDLLLGGPDASLGELEDRGFHRSDDLIAMIRYTFEGRYNILQPMLGMPGGHDMTTGRFDDHLSAAMFVMRAVENVDLASRTAMPLKLEEPEKFVEHWSDSLMLKRTLSKKRRIGVWGDSMAVVNYGDKKIVIPLTGEAREATHQHFPVWTARKFGGYVLSPDSWSEDMYALIRKCRGGVLYLDSISG